MTILDLSHVKDVQLRMATKEDKQLIGLDNTMFTAITTCPTWGIIRYIMGLTPSAGNRAMALEAGSTAHEAFAAVRLLELHRDKRSELLNLHGMRLFGEARWPLMLSHLESHEDENTAGLNFMLEAVNTSGFYDDPRDKRRTLSNIEEACIAYYDRWPFGKWPLWIRNVDDPQSDVGIEIPFELVIEFTTNDGQKLACRFIGKMDGLHLHKDNILRVHENKTASRLNQAWADSFQMAHQVTGYCVAATVFTEQQCDDAIIHGLSLPLPKSYDFGGIMVEPVHRYPHHVHHWLNWVLFTLQIIEKFKDNVIEAPRFTHSCNRYFRTCSMLPYCSSEDEDKPDIMGMMVYEPWSPLDEQPD